MEALRYYAYFLFLFCALWSSGASAVPQSACAASVGGHLLQTEIEVLPYQRPLLGTEPLVAQAKRKKDDCNTLCGSVSLANGIAKISGRPALEILNQVLHVLVRRTHRDDYDLEYKGLEAKQLKSLTELALTEMGYKFRLSVLGKWSWSDSVTNIRIQDLQKASHANRFILAFIQKGYYGVTLKGDEIPKTLKGQRETLALEALSKSFSMIGKNGSGHIVKLDGLTEVNGEPVLHYSDPELKDPQAVRMTPFTSLKSGYDSFILSLNPSGLSRYRAKNGEPRLIVEGEAKVMSSIFVVEIL